MLGRMSPSGGASFHDYTTVPWDFFFFFNLLCVGAKCEAQHAYPHIEMGGRGARGEWFAPEIQLRASGLAAGDHELSC